MEIQSILFEIFEKEIYKRYILWREIRISADPASPSADWSRAHHDLLPDCQSADFLIKKVFSRDKIVPFRGIPDIGQ